MDELISLFGLPTQAVMPNGEAIELTSGAIRHGGESG